MSTYFDKTLIHPDPTPRLTLNPKPRTLPTQEHPLLRFGACYEGCGPPGATAASLWWIAELADVQSYVRKDTRGKLTGHMGGGQNYCPF